MRHLAENAAAGACSAKDLAEVYSIPQEALAKILQKLAKSRLLVSQQGTNGGYVLGRDPRSISFTWTTTPPRRWIRACSRRCCRTSPTEESCSATPPAATTASAGTAEEAVEKARKQIADLIGANPRRSSSPAAPPNRTTWPSRASRRCTPKRATTSSPRPPSTRRARYLQAPGEARLSVTYLPVQKDGLIDLDDCARRSPTRPSWSASCTPTTKSACCSRSRNRQDRQGEGRAVPHRRGAGVGKVPVNVIDGQHRPDVAQRAQDVRTEGRGRAVRAAQAIRACS
jgi:Rrf2 family protein